ncbi:hypothetical protein ISU10_03575 [Nocardioides agariphilus]|uniref:Uncharacterized protein n=1 Tax=Nocardioides agariphilus TaxID=433664 RepID=A0A930VJM5_9ACTN|nr:hypothetical protein [Nocardioides agariphilus]MBF4766846.1 hypothetical protein [Nocardioides agariphilus]
MQHEQQQQDEVAEVNDAQIDEIGQGGQLIQLIQLIQPVQLVVITTANASVWRFPWPVQASSGRFIPNHVDLGSVGTRQLCCRKLRTVMP